MDFRSMKRKKLQALCKKHGILANLTNLEMANKLSATLKENERRTTHGRSCLKSSDEILSEDESDVVKRHTKRVRFSPDNEVFEFQKSDIRYSKRNGVGRRRSRTRAATKSMGLVVENFNGDEFSNLLLDYPVRLTRSQAQRCATVGANSVLSPQVQRKRGRKEVKGVDESGKQPPEVHLSVNLDSRISAGVETRMLTRRSLRNSKIVDDEKMETEAVDNFASRKSTGRRESKMRKESSSEDKVAEQQESFKRMEQNVVAQGCELVDGDLAFEMPGRKWSMRAKSRLTAESFAADHESETETGNEVQMQGKAVPHSRQSSRKFSRGKPSLPQTKDKDENLKDLEAAMPHEEPRKQRSALRQPENQNEDLGKLEVILPIEEPRKYSLRHGSRRKSLMPEIKNKDEALGNLEVVLPFVEPKKRSERYGDMQVCTIPEPETKDEGQPKRYSLGHGSRRKSLLPPIKNKDKALRNVEAILPFVEPKKYSERYGDMQKSTIPEPVTKDEVCEKLEVALQLEEPKKCSSRYCDRRKSIMPQTKGNEGLGKLEVVLPFEEPKRRSTRYGNKRKSVMPQTETKHDNKRKSVMPQTETKHEVKEKLEVVLQLKEPLKCPRRNGNRRQSAMPQIEDVGADTHLTAEHNNSNIEFPEEDNMQHSAPLRRSSHNNSVANSIGLTKEEFSTHESGEKIQLKEQLMGQEKVSQIDKQSRRSMRNATRIGSLSVSVGTNGIANVAGKNKQGKGRGQSRLEERTNEIKNVSESEKDTATIATGSIHREKKQGNGLKSPVLEAEASSVKGIPTLKEIPTRDCEQTILDLAEGTVNPVSGSREVEDDTKETRGMQQSIPNIHAKSHVGLEAVVMGTSDLDEARSFSFITTVERSAYSALKSQNVQKKQAIKISLDDSMLHTEVAKISVEVDEENLSKKIIYKGKLNDLAPESVCNNLVGAGFTDTDQFANKLHSLSNLKETGEERDFTTDTITFPSSSYLVDLVDERIPVKNDPTVEELEVGCASLQAQLESELKDDAAATVICETPNKIHGHASYTTVETKNCDIFDGERLEATIQEHMEVAEEPTDTDEIQAYTCEPKVQNIEMETPLSLLASEKQHHPIFLEVSNIKFSDHTTALPSKGNSSPVSLKQQNESSDSVSGVILTNSVAASNISEANDYSFYHHSDHIDEPSNIINSKVDIELEEPSSIEHEALKVGSKCDNEAKGDPLSKERSFVESDKHVKDGRLTDCDKAHEKNSDSKLEEPGPSDQRVAEEPSNIKSSKTEVELKGPFSMEYEILKPGSTVDKEANFDPFHEEQSFVDADRHVDGGQWKESDKAYESNSDRKFDTCDSQNNPANMGIDEKYTKEVEDFADVDGKMGMVSVPKNVHAKAVTHKFPTKAFSVSRPSYNGTASSNIGFQKCCVDSIQEKIQSHESFDGTMCTKTHDGCVAMDENFELGNPCLPVSEGVGGNSMHGKFDGEGTPVITHESDNGGDQSLYSTAAPGALAKAIGDVSLLLYTPRESNRIKLANNCQNIDEGKQVASCGSEIDIEKISSMLGDGIFSHAESQKPLGAEGVSAAPVKTAVTADNSLDEFRLESATFSEVGRADDGIPADKTPNKLRKGKFSEGESQEMIVPENCRPKEEFVNMENALPVANNETSDGGSSQSSKEIGTYTCGTGKFIPEVSGPDDLFENEENALPISNKKTSDGALNETSEDNQVKLLFSTPINVATSYKEKRTSGTRKFSEGESQMTVVPEDCGPYEKFVIKENSPAVSDKETSNGVSSESLEEYELKLLFSTPFNVATSSKKKKTSGTGKFSEGEMAVPEDCGPDGNFTSKKKALLDSNKETNSEASNESSEEDQLKLMFSIPINVATSSKEKRTSGTGNLSKGEMVGPEDYVSDEKFVNKENATPVSNKETGDEASSESSEDDLLKLLFSTPINASTSYKENGTLGTEKFSEGESQEMLEPEDCGPDENFVNKKNALPVPNRETSDVVSIESSEDNQLQQPFSTPINVATSYKEKGTSGIGNGDVIMSVDKANCKTALEIRTINRRNSQDIMGQEGSEHDNKNELLTDSKEISNGGSNEEKETFCHQQRETITSKVRNGKFSLAEAPNTTGEKECENEEACDQGEELAINEQDITDGAPRGTNVSFLLSHTISRSSDMITDCEASMVEEAGSSHRSTPSCPRETQNGKVKNDEGILAQSGAFYCDKVVLFDGDYTVKRLSTASLSEEGERVNEIISGNVIKGKLNLAVKETDFSFEDSGDLVEFMDDFIPESNETHLAKSDKYKVEVVSEVDMNAFKILEKSNRSKGRWGIVEHTSKFYGSISEPNERKFVDFSYNREENAEALDKSAILMVSKVDMNTSKTLEKASASRELLGVVESFSKFEGSMLQANEISVGGISCNVDKNVESPEKNTSLMDECYSAVCEEGKVCEGTTADVTQTPEHCNDEKIADGNIHKYIEILDATSGSHCSAVCEESKVSEEKNINLAGFSGQRSNEKINDLDSQNEVGVTKGNLDVTDDILSTEKPDTNYSLDTFTPHFHHMKNDSSLNTCSFTPISTHVGSKDLAASEHFHSVEVMKEKAVETKGFPEDVANNENALAETTMAGDGYQSPKEAAQTDKLQGIADVAHGRSFNDIIPFVCESTELSEVSVIGNSSSKPANANTAAVAAFNFSANLNGTIDFNFEYGMFMDWEVNMFLGDDKESRAEKTNAGFSIANTRDSIMEAETSNLLTEKQSALPESGMEANVAELRCCDFAPSALPTSESDNTLKQTDVSASTKYCDSKSNENTFTNFENSTISNQQELEKEVGGMAGSGSAAMEKQASSFIKFSGGYDFPKGQETDSVEEKIPDARWIDRKNKSPRLLNSTAMKRNNNAKASMVPVTPSKLLMTSDMKENIPTAKRDHIGSRTTAKSTKKRRALEYLE